MSARRSLGERVSQLLGIPVEERIGPSGNLSLHAPTLKRSITFASGDKPDPIHIAWNWSRT